LETKAKKQKHRLIEVKKTEHYYYSIIAIFPIVAWAGQEDGN
jgi:hypothetical protein